MATTTEATMAETSVTITMAETIEAIISVTIAATVLTLLSCAQLPAIDSCTWYASSCIV